MKKLLSGITAMVLMLGLFTTGVQAKGANYQEVNLMIEQTNKEIYELVDKADDKADAFVLMHEADKISQDELNNKLDEIINQLVKTTTQKTDKLIKEAAKSGVVIEPTWVEVEVGGRTVLVDPCISDGF